VKDGVGWVGVIGQNVIFYQDKIVNPCEVIEIHNLPQNPPKCSFINALHRCGVSGNFVACSFSSVLGLSILDEWESQIILGSPILNA